MSQLKLVNTSWCLEKICETNFEKLFRLIPNLCTFDKQAIAQLDHKPSLHLAILERNPYTLTIELSHCFNGDQFKLMTPCIRIRLYLDAQLAEVIRDQQRPAVEEVYNNPGLLQEIRDYKWQMNYFLEKWLDHCLKTDYRFVSADVGLSL